MSLALRFDTRLQLADLLRDGGNLLTDGGLETAVLISLFSDGRAADTDVDPNADRRGWWADGLGEEDAVVLAACKLWLLGRMKPTQETAARAREYALAALQWLVDDGVARMVEVTARWVAFSSDTRKLELDVAIERTEGTRWRRAWEVRLAV